MEISLIDNVSRKLVDVLGLAITESADCRIAVAYVSVQGLRLLDPAIQACLQRGGYVEFLVGLDLEVTEPQALRTLHQMSQTSPKITLYCMADPGPSAVYHPKLYVIRGDTATIVIGSSNLTEGGLRQNLEANAWIRAEIQEEIVSDAYALYNSLKFHPRRVQPDEEFISLYEEMRRVKERQQRSDKADIRFRELKSRFQDKVNSLRRPVVTSEDLIGWQKLVYSRLPQGQFRTRDLYPFEDEFRQYYPQNQNIRAKIRQVLQQLRDLGLIEHRGREVWFKQ